MAETFITDITTETILVPLPGPLPVGDTVITDREYAVVRVHTADGIQGTAYCLSRNAPIAAIIDRLLRPHLVGQPSEDAPELWHRLLRGSALVGRVGLVRRVIGLLDIAVWDIVAQRAGLPLWQLLGNSAGDRRTMLVAAYTAPDVAARETVARMLAASNHGWQQMKITRSPDNDKMREIFARLRTELPSAVSIVVDANFSWHSADDVIADFRTWHAPDLAWLEDPLLPEEVAACAHVRSQTGQRIGVGDEVTDPRLLDALTDHGAIDVMRVDVVAIGGITPARKVIARARERGLAISGHVYPEITSHLGIDLETFDRSADGNPYDPVHTIIQGGPSFRPGWTTPPTAPGLGFSIASAFDTQAKGGGT